MAGPTDGTTISLRGNGSGLAVLLCLGGAVFLWGTSFMATKAALAGFRPWG